MQPSHNRENHVSLAQQSRTQPAWILILGIVFIAATLRAPFTSVGPLLNTIRDSLGISNTLAGFLTTVPLLAFAFISPLAPRLAHRYGMERVLFGALFLLTAGIAIRYIPSTIPVFIGTAVLSSAIALGNVLLPSFIKQKFPDRIGLLTGIYTASMNLSAAVALGLSVPLAEQLGLGWNGSLAFWGLIVIATILLWIPHLRGQAVVSAASTSKVKMGGMWKSALAWQVTLFLGVQSVIFYITVTWFPDLLIDRGFTPSSAGWMVSLMQFAQIPMTFITPIIASRMKDQRKLVVFFGACYFISIAGFSFGHGWVIPVSAVILGIAGGSSFSLAMMLFTLRTRTAQEAAELSGMAQSFGYILAATGPLLFGMLHDVTGDWSLSLIYLFASSVLLFIFGLGAARNRLINDTKPGTSDK
ncbi:CynX/NimT family MFS transporter [Paenibacillus marinisediminis]